MVPLVFRVRSRFREDVDVPFWCYCTLITELTTIYPHKLKEEMERRDLGGRQRVSHLEIGNHVGEGLEDDLAITTGFTYYNVGNFCAGNNVPDQLQG